MNRTIVQFAGVVLVAFAIRFIHLWQSQSVVFFYHPISDGLAYDTWAQQIAAGEWLGKTVFYQAPLYPYFLAVVQRVVGHDLYWVRIVQIALGSLACGFVLLAGRNLFGVRAGLLAGIIMAIYAPAIYFDALLQKTVLDTFFMSILLWLVSRRDWAVRYGPLVALGCVLGLLALTRENALLLTPILAGAFLLNGRAKKKQRWISASIFIAGIALVLVPVGIRNKVVGGEFALTTSQAGTNFFIGNNAKANGMYIPLRRGREDPLVERTDATELAETAVSHHLTPAEVSRFWFAQAFEYIRAQPLDWLRLMGRKIALTLNAYEVPDAEDIYFYARSCSAIRILGTTAHFGVLLPLAVAGCLLARPRHPAPHLFAVLAVTWLIGVVLFYVSARYRFPLIPILALFAAAALTEAARLIAAREWKRLLPAAVAVGVVSVVANWPIFPKSQFLPFSYLNAASAYLEMGDNDHAVEFARTGLAMRQDMTAARQILGNGLSRMGHGREAILELQRAVREDPSGAPLHNDLGVAYSKVGDWREAGREFELAFTIDPSIPNLRINVILAALQTDNFARAIPLLREQYAASPEDPVAALELGWLLATCPDESLRRPAEAVRVSEELRARQPNPDPEVLDLAAAAYASAGRFDDAVSTARSAAELARRIGRLDLAGFIEQRLRRYEAHQPPVYTR